MTNNKTEEAFLEFCDDNGYEPLPHRKSFFEAGIDFARKEVKEDIELLLQLASNKGHEYNCQNGHDESYSCLCREPFRDEEIKKKWGLK